MSSSVVDSSVMRVNASMGAHGAGRMLCTGHTIEFQCYFTTAARPNTPRSNGAGQSEDVDEASAEDRAFKNMFKGSGSMFAVNIWSSVVRAQKIGCAVLEVQSKRLDMSWCACAYIHWLESDAP